jgi:hypothetical protein
VPPMSRAVETGVVNLSEVIDQLYRLPPDQFTAQRDSLASKAREEGDRPLSQAIRGLRKPTTGAWLANLLVRTHPDDVERALEIGSALRHAQLTLSGEGLRDLARQRREAVRALSATARELAGGLDHKVAGSSIVEFQETIEAALADEEMAHAVRSGMLVTGLHYTGLGLPTPATSKSPSRPARTAAGRRSARAPVGAGLRQAEHDAVEARRTLQASSQAASQAERELDRLRHRIVELERELNTLRETAKDATLRVSEMRRAQDAAAVAEQRASSIVSRLQGEKK